MSHLHLLLPGRIYRLASGYWCRRGIEHWPRPVRHASVTPLQGITKSTAVRP